MASSPLDFDSLDGPHPQLNKIPRKPVIAQVTQHAAAIDPSSEASSQSSNNEGPSPAQSHGEGKPAGGFLSRRHTAASHDNEKLKQNYRHRFSGKKGLKRFRWVYHPHSQAELGHDPDPERLGSTVPEDEDSDKGEVVKQDGKFVYRNEFHQTSRKFADVAVYLSPTNAIPRRLVVQASPYVIHNHRDKGDWIRTKVRGSVPMVLKMSEWAVAPTAKDGVWRKLHASIRLLLVAVPIQLLLATPGISSWSDDGMTETYTDYPGLHWDWPKYATNYLDMAPAAASERTPGALDYRTRARRPRKLVAKMGGQWVVVDAREQPGLQYIFISYRWEQFKEGDGGRDKLRRMAEHVTEMEGCNAYWMDRQLVDGPPGAETDYDVYTMCDIVRGSKRVALMLPDNSTESKEGWGRRMWTLPEGLLAPGDGIRFCYEDAAGQLVVNSIHKVEMTSTFWGEPASGDGEEDGGGTPTRVLAEHFSGQLTLSRLELLPAAIAALATRERNEYTGSDPAYAVMGLLHYRIDRDDSNSVFQNLARLSLRNDSDQLIERMLSLLPRTERIVTPNGPLLPSSRHTFDILSEQDQFGTMVYHVEPLCDIVGVAAEDESVIIDNCRSIHIRWKDFPQAVAQRHYGFKKLIATVFVAAGLWWLTFGIQLVISYLPLWAGFVKGVDDMYVGWIVLGFLFVALLLSASAPLAVRRLFGGIVLKSTPRLIGIEGVMDIEELEKIVFGNYNARLTYAPSATPFCNIYRDAKERRGTQPDWFRDPDRIMKSLPARHHIFTLVDMGELSVSIFSAERPPTVALLCGREGGMLRAVLCSWRFENDCLYRETVVRMPSRVYEAAVPKGWLKLSLQTQDQNRLATKTGSTKL
jgi:hypothetical protein